MKDRHFRCGSLRILLLLCLIVSKQTTIQADIVKGRVVDAETKEPQPEATVKLSDEDIHEIINIIHKGNPPKYRIVRDGEKENELLLSAKRF